MHSHKIPPHTSNSILSVNGGTKIVRIHGKKKCATQILSKPITNKLHTLLKMIAQRKRTVKKEKSSGKNLRTIKPQHKSFYHLEYFAKSQISAILISKDTK